MPHDHVWKKIDPLGIRKVRPLGHDPGNRIKILSDIFLYLSFVRTNAKFGIKIFEIDFVFEIKY